MAIRTTKAAIHPKTMAILTMTKTKDEYYDTNIHNNENSNTKDTALHLKMTKYQLKMNHQKNHT